MSDYHEDVKLLDEKTKDCARALNSLKEEVEAVDWYHQRMSASKNENLIKILKHNRDEEIEHACMMIEWLRRNMDGWDEQLKTFLFKNEPITEIEDEMEEECDSLKIGNLK